MCCLFGIMDCQHSLSGREMTKAVNILARLSEIRGTDATGIAYNNPLVMNCIEVEKYPKPAHRIKFRIPEGVHTVMGHTRLTTQGDAAKNRNNHPFTGKSRTLDGYYFALAHNGVLFNDKTLRKQKKLPLTKIETDSYIAVQLLEQEEIPLDFQSLKNMAETVEGSFVFTILDAKEQLYFIKGDNPLMIYYFPKSGIYLYASLESILKQATKRCSFLKGEYEKIQLKAGDILKIDAMGNRSGDTFDATIFDYSEYYYPYYYGSCYPHYIDISPGSDTASRCLNGKHIRKKTSKREDDEIFSMRVDALRHTACMMGYEDSFIDEMLMDGFSLEELESEIYCW